MRGVAMALLGLSAACGRTPAAECVRALESLSFQTNSTVGPTVVEAGPLLDCRDSRVAAIAPELARAVRRAPLVLPRPLKVHLDPTIPDGPALTEIETHASGELLLASRSNAYRDPSILLHELFHVAAAGKRPDEPRLARAVTAMEEGAADYFAASVLADPKVGAADGREVRNLAKHHSVTEQHWVATVTGQIGPHELGFGLSSRLWRDLGPSPERARLLAECLGDLPKQSSLTTVTECTRVRDPRLASSLRGWALVDAGDAAAEDPQLAGILP